MNISELDLSKFSKIENNIEILKYLVKDQSKLFLLTADNRANFKALYGKRNYTFTGNYHYYIWVIDENFILFTAKNRGTDIYAKKDISVKKIILFINKLYTSLLNLKPKKC